MLGTDGKPLVLAGRRSTQSAAAEALKKTKKARKSAIVPAGRVVTITAIRAKDGAVCSLEAERPTLLCCTL